MDPLGDSEDSYEENDENAEAVENAENAEAEAEDAENAEAEAEDAEVVEDADADRPSFVQPIGGPQVASPTTNAEDWMMFIQLGDRILIDCQYGKVVGTVYYRSLELIRVRPDGVSNTLYHFNMEQTDEGESFAEEDQVTTAHIIEKRKKEAFVDQQDFRVNQEVATFDKEGRRYRTFRVTDVNTEEDRLNLQPLAEEEEETIVVECGFVGIPTDLPFTTISIVSAGPSQANWNETAPVVEEEVEEVEEEEEEDIEVVGVIQVTNDTVYEEAEVYEQRIPDNLQRIDALNDFLSDLSPALQKDKKELRTTRVLVDTLYYLQKLSMEYNPNGSIQGPAEVSVTTLVDLIQRSIVPLGRPVLRITKKEYEVPSEEEEERQPTEEVRFENFEEELERILAKFNTLPSTIVQGASSINEYWHTSRTFLERYGSPWESLPRREPMWNAMKDSDFFRTSPPVSVDGSQGFHLPGYVRPVEGELPIFYRIPFGLERALATTYRKGKERNKEGLLSEERAPLDSYVLFPLSMANTMGSTRSSSLAIDSGRSQMPPRTMKSMLRELGEPREDGTANDLILLDVVGNSLGNITLASYVQGLTLPCLGLGDALPYLRNYGLDEMELNEELHDVLQRKIESYQSQLTSTLARLRNVLSPESKPEPNPFLVDPLFFASMLSQPLLANDLKEYGEINLSLAESDIGKVAYLMKKHPNYVEIAAGKNSKMVARAFHTATRGEYFQQLQINETIKKNERGAGERPQKNSCHHVSDLVSMRRIREDNDRFREFVKIFRAYQGARNENWIDCNTCHAHFVCVHERLQIQAFLNPKEKDAIEKELILSFSGGQFQGKYICRNCGQPMRDLDFDQNLEFDENGRPKSGNAVLTDEDAEWNDKIDMAVSAPLEPSSKETMKLSEKEQSCYDMIQSIAETVGVFMDEQGYRNVIRPMIEWMAKFPSKAAYGNAAPAKEGKKRPDYEVAVARDQIAACGVFLLLEIQTHIPSYVVRYQLTGCKSPGFGGYPLETDETSKQGIEYLACAISYLRKKGDLVWERGFQSIVNDQARQTLIISYFMLILSQNVRKDVIQAQLSEKRRYMVEMLGQSADGLQAMPKDMIPATFLPEQMVLTAEEAAKEPIQAEVAATMGARGRAALVKLWIRQAHHMARSTATLIRGLPYSETTCCANPLLEPGAFWRQKEMPEIPGRTLTPHLQGSNLLTEFHPREAGQNVTEPNKDLYYRLFLKYCFKGDRVGHPHQPGLTHLCLWCGFQFPTNPAIMDVNKEGKDALADVDTNTEEFTDLLDTIHHVNKVESIALPEAVRMETMMERLSNVQPAPTEDWKTIIMETLSRMKTIRQGAQDTTRLEIISAAGELSQVSAPLKNSILERLAPWIRRENAKPRGKRYEASHFETLLQGIDGLSWFDFFKVVQTYFMIPFQRIVSNFSGDSLMVSNELKQELSVTHVDEYLKPMLQRETLFMESNKGLIQSPKLRLARAKLRYALTQFTELLPFMNDIRPNLVPGKDVFLRYVQQAILYGPLHLLLNSLHDPEDAYDENPAQDPSIDFLLDVLAHQLNKYAEESLSYDADRIKYLIAVRNEKERTNVLKGFNDLSLEEREVELMNKRLGLGQWAVGGTKLIYAYDADYWDQERQKRLDAGIFDFPGSGDGQLPVPQGAERDEMGLRVYQDEDYEREGGYEHDQMNADDA